MFWQLVDRFFFDLTAELGYVITVLTSVGFMLFLVCLNAFNPSEKIDFAMLILVAFNFAHILATFLAAVFRAKKELEEVQRNDKRRIGKVD